MSQTEKASERGGFVQYPCQLIYNCSDLNRDDKWVLLSIMGVCWTEGPYRLSYRDIAALSGVPLSLLSSIAEKNEKPAKEGIMDRLKRLEYVRCVMGKETDTTTGKAKGNAQTYIYVNYKKIWGESIFYKTDPYKVKENYQPVPNTNRSVSYTNELVLIRNRGVRIKNGSVPDTNEPVRDASSKSPIYISYMDLDNCRQKEDKEESIVPANADHYLTISSFENLGIADLSVRVACDEYWQHRDMLDLSEREPAHHLLETGAAQITLPAYSQQNPPQEEILTDQGRRVGKNDVRSLTFEEIKVAQDHAQQELLTNQASNPVAVGCNTPSPSGEKVDASSVPATGVGEKQPDEPPVENKRANRGKKQGNGENTQPKDEKPSGPPQMPPAEMKWCEEKMVQIVEAKNGKYYSDLARPDQVKAAEKIMKKKISEEQFVHAYDKRNDTWWRAHKGKLHVTHMAAKTDRGPMRVVEILCELEGWLGNETPDTQNERADRSSTNLRGSGRVGRQISSFDNPEFDMSDQFYLSEAEKRARKETTYATPHQ
jgi:hypothetical protein